MDQLSTTRSFIRSLPERWRSPRFRGLLASAAIGLLLVVVLVETAIIINQVQVNRRIEAQTEEALGRFLRQGAAQAEGPGTRILLRNVNFCWSRQVCVSTDQLAATALPLNQGSEVNFDDLKSFLVKIHNARVLMRPQTLEGMLNESVFNYPGSNLRNLSVRIVRGGAGNAVRLAGSLKYVLWIPFEMDTRLWVDHRSNTLVIGVDSLRVFGILPATWLIELKPFNLDKLLAVPSNRHLTVRRNLIMVKPFGLFPPPRVDGKIAAIAVTPAHISLTFSGKNIAHPNIPIAAPNFIYLSEGPARFGRVRMSSTRVEVIDGDPRNAFRFSLLNYRSYLPSSRVKLDRQGGAVLLMADHANIPDMGRRVFRPRNDIGPGQRVPGLEEAAESGKGVDSFKQGAERRERRDSFWQRAKRRFRHWFDR